MPFANGFANALPETRGKPTATAIGGAALANKMNTLRKAGTGKVSIIAFGDSITEGASASTKATQYTSVLAASLRTALGRPTSNARYYPSQNILGLAADWTFTGMVNAFNQLGHGFRGSQVTVGATASCTFNGTGFDLLYTKCAGAGTLSYTVDGGAATVIDSKDVPAIAEARTTITGLAPGNHTVVVTSTVDNVYLNGLYAYDGDQTNGIHVINAGHAGYRFCEYGPIAFANSVTSDSVRTSDADACTIALGLNEYGTAGIQRTLAQVRDDVRYMICEIRNYRPNIPIFLVIPQERRVDAAPAETWAQWRAAYYSFAAENFCSVIDVGAALGSFVGGGNPYDAGDQVHLNDAGMARQAAVISAALLNTQASPVTTLAETDLGLTKDILAAPWANNGCVIVNTGTFLADGTTPIFTVQDANENTTIYFGILFPTVTGKHYRIEILLRYNNVVTAAGTSEVFLQVMRSDFSGGFSVSHNPFNGASGISTFGNAIGTEIRASNSVDADNPLFRKLVIEFTAIFTDSPIYLVYPGAVPATAQQTITVSRPKVARIY